MSIEAVQYADRIILETLEKGLAHPDTKDNPIVESRLNLFGYWEGRTFYLNERGMDYAMNGCSRGIIERQAKDSYINDLSIEATKKAMNDADRAYIQAERSISVSKHSNHIAWAALFVSILGIVLSFVLP